MSRASGASGNAALNLFPCPKFIRRQTGTCLLAGTSPLESRVHDPRIERALLQWRTALPSACAGVPIRVIVDRSLLSHVDGYQLTITPGAVTLVGGSPSGCFHGLQTLTQLAQLAAGRARLPCVAITDEPSFATRGLLHDVSRGKVPTLATLKGIVDRLAQLKANQLQLYIEHAFVFEFDPEICGPEDGLTPDEVRELDHYCCDRFIDLVPAVGTPGHMGRILSIPKYRHLAEIEATKPWLTMTWPERARGFTLDCMNPEAHALVQRMWSDVLDAFSSPAVNICGDEPWDLGKGKNREAFTTTGSGVAYVEHLRRIQRFCSTRGRSVMFWSDVLRNYPQLLDEELRKGTVLHWGYDNRADYEATGLFTKTGMKTFVCPGTSGWKRILNAMDLAELNIATFAAAGKRHGAAGLLNTDWGDHGHFNALACSWHGIALGTALAWDADHATGSAFDANFARGFCGLSDSEGLRLLRLTSRHAAQCETWRLFWMPLAEVAKDPSLPDLPTRSESTHYADLAAQWWRQQNQDSAELALACRFSALCDEKLRFAHALRDSPIEPLAIHDWAAGVEAAGRQFAELWQARNKPSGLQDILTALAAAIEDVRIAWRS